MRGNAPVTLRQTRKHAVEHRHRAPKNTTRHTHTHSPHTRTPRCRDVPAATRTNRQQRARSESIVFAGGCGETCVARRASAERDRAQRYTATKRKFCAWRRESRTRIFHCVAATNRLRVRPAGLAFLTARRSSSSACPVLSSRLLKIAPLPPLLLPGSRPRAVLVRSARECVGHPPSRPEFACLLALAAINLSKPRHPRLGLGLNRNEQPPGAGANRELSLLHIIHYTRASARVASE